MSSNRLRALGLTLEDIANAVRRGSTELSAGKISTGEEEIRVRTIGQNYDQYDFEEIIVLSRPDGTSLRLGDIADLRDGFADTELITRFNGNRAVRVDVSRTADEQVLEIAKAVRAYLAAEVVPNLPEGVSVEIWRDDTTLVGSRLSLLIENGLLGLALVFLGLTLFLEIRLAVWVGAGLVVSLVATLWVMRILGISINMFSMLALVLALGIVGTKARVRAILLTSVTTFLGVAPLVFERDPAAQHLVPVAAALAFGVLIATPLLLLVVPALVMSQANFGARLSARVSRTVPWSQTGQPT